MKTAEEIFETIRQKAAYGNVDVTRADIIGAMEEYANQFRKADVSGSVCEKHKCDKVCPQCENDTFPM